MQSLNLMAVLKNQLGYSSASKLSKQIKWQLLLKTNLPGKTLCTLNVKDIFHN